MQSLNSVFSPHNRKSVIASKTACPPRSLVSTKSVIRMEQQEAQQLTVSVAEFNEVKNELRNLTHLTTIMMKRFDNQVPPLATHDLSSSPIVRSQEALISKNQHVHVPFIQINVLQSVPKYDHHEISQYKEEILAGIDRETKAKVNELERSSSRLKEQIL